MSRVRTIERHSSLLFVVLGSVSVLSAVYAGEANTDAGIHTALMLK